jgi:hypothetical protein
MPYEVLEIAQKTGCFSKQITHSPCSLCPLWLILLKSKHRGVNDGEHILQHITRRLFNQLHSA